MRVSVRCRMAALRCFCNHEKKARREGERGEFIEDRDGKDNAEEKERSSHQ